MNLSTDGGLTTLGANVFNMGIIDSIGGYGIYRTLRTLRVGDRPAVAMALVEVQALLLWAT